MLLTDYPRQAHQQHSIAEFQNPSKQAMVAAGSEPLGQRLLEYAGCSWKVNVVLSTNHLSKVLRPEVVIEIQTAQRVPIKMTLSPEKFEELRRQVAGILRSCQQIECVKVLNVR